MPTPASDAYRRALLAARERDYALRVAALRRIDRALDEYTRRLRQQLRALPRGTDATTRRLALQRALEIASQEQRQLAVLLERAVEDGRRTAFEDVLAMHREATMTVARAHDVPGHLLGAVTTPRVTMAGAWESLDRGAATWRTLLRTHVANAVADTQQLVTTALVTGMSPDELATRLRPYVLGAESFQQAFRDTGVVSDATLAASPLRGAASRLRFNADRIAFSEVHNARAEAEVQAFAADPFVKAVRWQLSPNRGKGRRPDACDALAKTDYFGLGAGVYPVTQVPVSPHPFCRCERVPVSRPSHEMNQPKPNPPRRQDPVVLGTGCG